MTAGLTGRDPTANIWRRFRCIYGDCNAILLFTSRKKISTSVLLLRYVCSYRVSYIKTNGLFQYQTRTTAWFDIFSRMHFKKKHIKFQLIQ